MTDFFENCGYYAGGECNICGMGISGEDTFCRLCKDNPNCYYKQISELKAENDRLKEENGRLNRNIIEALKHEKEALDVSIKYKDTLQEIKGVVTALYMNNWLQMNETARKSIQLLQELITKAEEE